MSAPPPVGSLCFHCGYDLRSLSQNVCPECGNSFDPQNPITYVHPAFGRRTRRLRRLLEPPPLFDCVAVGVAALFVVVRSSSPEWPYILVSSAIRQRGFGPAFWLPFLFFIGLVPIVNFIRRKVALARLARLNLNYSSPRLLRQPMILVFSLVLITSLFYPWPFFVRFALSYPALEKVVQANEIRREPSWIGLFHVKKVRIYADKIVFFATDSGGFRERGLAFARDPTMPPRKLYWTSRRLTSRWWIILRAEP